MATLEELQAEAKRRAEGKPALTPLQRLQQEVQRRKASDPRNAVNAAIEAAKAGTLKLSPERAAQQAEIDAKGAEIMQRPGVMSDVLKSAGAGLARGAAGIADAPYSLMSGYADLVTGGLQKMGMSPEFAGNMRSGMVSALPGASGLGATPVRNVASAVTGGATDYKGQTTPGQYAGTIGEFLPGAMMGGGGVGKTALNALQYGVLPGAASEAAGQITEGSAAEPYARVAAALLAPMGAGLANKGVRAAISPYGGADPARLAMADDLAAAGVPLTAGQRTGAEGLRRIEGSTGAGQAMMGQQADDFTRAALRAVGEDATRATPDVMQRTATRIGGMFDDATRGVDVTPDAGAVTAMASAVDTYKRLAPAATTVPLIREINAEFVKAFRTGRSIPAATVTTWRSQLSGLTTSADRATRDAARAAMDAVDGALNSALSAAGRTDDIALLDTARKQWRDYLALQTAVTRAGEDAALGIVSPARLSSAVTGQGRAAMATGRRGEMGDLARAGVGAMSPLPTVQAGGVRNIPQLGTLIGGGLGATAGTAMGSPTLGAIAGMVAPDIAKALMMTRPGQAYLGNQMVKPGGPVISPEILRVLTGLLTQQAGAR